ncbi:MAG: SusC/RagA family TonB-linked outer membrane protein [Bacteroidales bacterium]|nr:SusC/RagA family TonB-linked outer membrane protein [Bacteroidales bacterium]
MKRIVTKLVGIMLLSLVTTAVSAQNGYQVKGVVTDALGPVIGATVIEQGTTNGTTTGIDGDFILNVASANSTIEVSCIGYATQTFKASEVPATIHLEEDSEFLDEVVVIGYGTVKKSDLTGSVSTVKADQLTKGVATSPTTLLQGKSAGVVVTSGDGAPGSGNTIRIRGGSSLKANNDPLIVIDGLPISEVGITGVADQLSSINPSDIESFTVLKDASATAIFGSRASNGVIIITTKKGSKFDNSVHVDFDFTGSVSQNTKYVDVLTGDEIRALMAKRYGTDSDAYALLGSANTDWQKEIFQLARTLEGNVSVTGKVGKTNDFYMPYRLSLGYHNQDGTLKTSNLARETLAMSLTPTLLDEHLTVNLNAKGMNMDNRFANTGAIGAAVKYDPTKPVYDNNGLNGYSWWNYGKGTFTVDNCNTMAGQNPMALLNDFVDYANAKRFVGNAQFDYKLHGFEDLRFNLNLGIDYSRSNETIDVAPDTEQSMHSTAQQANNHASGYHQNKTQTKNDQTLEFYTDYSHDFDGHFIDLMAGYSWSHYYYENFSETFKADGTSKSDASYYLSNPYTFKTEYFLVSFFGRVNYSYSDRYLITATLRRDGTSRFANNKWGLFPSVAVSWNIKNEPFMGDASALSALKLRASWGQTGQQDLNAGNYPSLATYTYNTDASMFIFGDKVITPITPNGYNADLKWETTTTINAGLDWGFFGDRLYGAFDVYKRNTFDLLNWTPVAAGANLTNYLNANIGDLENLGVEMEVNAVPVETKDWSWTLGFNAAYNKTIVTRLTSDDEREDYYGVDTGGISGGSGNTVQVHQTGQAPSSFYVYKQIYDTAGNPIEGAYVDLNNDGVTDAKDKYCFHKAAPDWTFGFNTQLSWKQWTLAASAHANVGNYVYNNVMSDGDLLTDLTTNGFVNNRYKTAEAHNFNNYAQYWSDMYVTNASFLKLDNITLQYSFSNLFKVGERGIGGSIFTTVNNVACLTGYKGIDPEIFNGIDNNMYPRPRTYILGVKFNF